MIHFESRRKLSIYTSLIALMIIVAYNILRIGIDFQLTESAKTAGFILFLLNLPLQLIETITIKGKNKILKDEYALIFILLIACCFISMLSVEAGYFFLILGAICFFRNIFLYLKTIDRQEIIPLLVFLPIISIFFSITVWKGGYIHPMLLEIFAFDNRSHVDTLFHTSIAQMIKTYLIPSTGLNGIPFMHYHFGSHYIFACLSRILNIHVFTFYQLAYPAIFLPLLMKTFGGIPINWSERNNPENEYKFRFWFWFILAGAFIGVFPLLTILHKAALEFPSILVSESYNLSMIFLFLIVNILLFNFDIKKGRFTLKLPTLIIILALVFLLGLTKSSTLVVFNITVFYLFIRLRLFKQRILVLFGGLIILLSLICLFIIVDRKSGDGTFEFFHFYKNYVRLGIMQFLFVYYFWSLVLILLCVIMIIFNEQNNLAERSQPYFILIESVLLICIAGAIPGIFLNIHGGSAGYFMDVQLWTSLVLIFVILPEVFKTIGGSIRSTTKNYTRKIIAISLFMLALFGGLVIKNNFQNSLLYFTEHNFGDKKNICGETILLSDRRGFVATIRQIADLNSRIESCLSKNQHYNILKQLYQMDTLALKKKGKTTFVVGDISDLSKKYPCYKYPFLIPSLTGIAMKNGYIFENCNARNYSFEYYKRDDIQTARNVSKASNDLIIDIKSGSVQLHPFYLQK